jgi:hypothetical protein
MEMVRRLAPLIAVFVLSAIVAGCGSGGGSAATPSACLGSVNSYLGALRDAPGPVRLGGDTAISDCFSDAQGSGEFADVGQTVIKAATQLNATARQDGGGEAAVELGYLDGAVRKGARNTAATAVDLVRRLESAARFTPGGESPGAAFERAYGKGYAAGESSG